jgi:hypothetical protein
MAQATLSSRSPTDLRARAWPKGCVLSPAALVMLYGDPCPMVDARIAASRCSVVCPGSVSVGRAKSAGNIGRCALAVAILSGSARFGVTVRSSTVLGGQMVTDTGARRQVYGLQAPAPRCRGRQVPRMHGATAPGAVLPVSNNSKRRHGSAAALKLLEPVARWNSAPDPAAAQANLTVPRCYGPNLITVRPVPPRT